MTSNSWRFLRSNHVTRVVVLSSQRGFYPPQTTVNFQPATLNLMTIFESVFWHQVAFRRKQLKRFMVEKCQVFPKCCSVASGVISGSRRLFMVAIAELIFFSLAPRSRHCWELSRLKTTSVFMANCYRSVLRHICISQ